MKIKIRQNGLNQAGESREQYVMNRFVTAIDRVVASQSGGERIRAVAWARLWHERVMFCSILFIAGHVSARHQTPEH